MVAKNAVVVAFVVVELPVTVKSPTIVEEAFEMKPVSVGKVEKTMLPVPVSSSKREMSSDDASMSASTRMFDTPQSVSTSPMVSMEVVETLLLKSVQSEARRQPKTEPEAVSQSKSFEVLVRPSPAVMLAS